MHIEPEERYIKNEGKCCPFCGSEDIQQHENMEPHTLAITFTSWCNNCDKEWHTTYEFSSLTYQKETE